MIGKRRVFGGCSLVAALLAVLAQSGCSMEEPAGAASVPLGGGFRCSVSRPLRGAGDIAVDGRGDILVATGPRYRGEGPASIVRKIDMNGKEIWAYRVPDGDELLPFGITTDTSNAVIVVGRGFRTEWLPNGVEDIRSWLYLLKLDSAGRLEFRRDFEGSGQFVAVSAAPSGDIVVHGRYSSVLDLGAGPMPDSGGPSTSFLAKFSAGGNLLWTRDFGNPDAQALLGIATDGTGGVLVAGRLMAPFDFGGGSLSPTPNSDPEDDIVQDAFLAKFDASGKHVWSKRFGGEGAQRFGNVVMDAAGNAIVLGYNTGEIKLGDQQFVGRSDIVAAFNPQGEHLFSAALPTTWGDAERIGISATGNVFVAGTFKGAIDLEGAALVSAGGSDLFALRLDSGGMVRAGARLGGAGDDYLWGLGVSSKGSVAVGGDFRGLLNFGCGFLSPGPNVDAFVAGFTL